MDYLITTPAQLAATLKSRRKTKGRSQIETAGKIGLLPKTVSALENRPEKSSIESLFKLLAALDLELVLRTKEISWKTSSTEEW